MDDFQSIYNARLQGLNDDRPVKSTSFKSWSEKLEAYVGSELLLNQLPFWIHLEDIASCLPVGDSDSPGASIIPVSQFETCSGSLSAQGTGRFRTAIASHALEMDTFLLAALLNALHAQLGRELFSVQLEGHGRDVFPEGVDVSRTIGWFTSTFPITIRLSRPGISECLSEISTARQKIPTSGTGYGILRYLSCSNQQAAAALRLNPGIRFNYLGSFDSDFGDGEFISVDGYNHYDRSPESPVDVDLSFEAAISGKELRWRIDYNRSIYTPEQIEAVMSLIQSELTPESVLQSLTRMKQTSVSTISEADFEGIDLG
jgi:non-ribosomal peptide synthase protein (TIGR01720 family)